MEVPREFRRSASWLAVFAVMLLAGPKFMTQLVYESRMSEILMRDLAQWTYLAYDGVILAQLGLLYLLRKATAGVCLAFAVGTGMAEVWLCYRFWDSDLPIVLGLVASAIASSFNIAILYMAYRVAAVRVAESSGTALKSGGS